MNVLDWIVVGALAVSSGFGFWRGAAYELVSVGGWFAAFAAAHWMSPLLAPALHWFDSASLRQALAWFLCFVLALVAASLVGALLRLLLRASGLGVFDRSLGALFGLLRGALIVLLLTMVARTAGWTTLQDSALVRESLLLPLVLHALALLTPLLPSSLSAAALPSAA